MKVCFQIVGCVISWAFACLLGFLGFQQAGWIARNTLGISSRTATDVIGQGIWQHLGLTVFLVLGAYVLFIFGRFLASTQEERDSRRQAAGEKSARELRDSIPFRRPRMLQR
ncbi:MAG: hypothetical protein V4473_00925 [Patescibacteria group bacterium]